MSGPSSRAGRGTGTRPPSRTNGTGRRPAPGPDRRLLRQRLVVFVTVTVLVALGIAAAQGCEGPARGLTGPSEPFGADRVTDGAGRGPDAVPAPAGADRRG